MTRRVAITGCGYISGLGLGREALTSAFKEGQSGIRSIEEDYPDVVMKEAAPVADYVPEDHFSKVALVQQLDPFSQFALVAAREAWAMSGFEPSDQERTRTAVVVGTSAGGLHTIDANFVQTARRVHPMAIPKLMASAPAGQVTMELNLHGPSFGVSSACSSAAHALAQACLLIRSGMADAAVAGGAEATCLKPNFRAWDALRVGAKNGCRPFSNDRDGIVLGEGGGIYVLEELESAKARGAVILAEIAGIGMTSDAGNLVAPNEEWIAAAMHRSLEDANLNPEDVGYINAHGTGTKLNDLTETNAMKAVFGDHAYKVAISSTKPVHGHTLGAAAGIELAAVLMALNEGIIAPTLNYSEADPECDLDYVPNEAREGKVKVALCNSFAFGGMNAVMALRSVS